MRLEMATRMPNVVLIQYLQRAFGQRAPQTLPGKSGRRIVVPHSPRVSRLAYLSEAELHAKLQDARRSLYRRDPAERAEVEVRRRVAPVEMVQEVERLQAKLHRAARTEVDVSRQRHIDRPPGRALHAVDRSVAE